MHLETYQYLSLPTDFAKEPEKVSPFVERLVHAVVRRSSNWLVTS